MATITRPMQAVLDALQAGPATVDELKDRTSTSRTATIDKALAGLNAAQLVSENTDDSGITRWTRVDPDQDLNPDDHDAQADVDSDEGPDVGTSERPEGDPVPSEDDTAEPEADPHPQAGESDDQDEDKDEDEDKDVDEDVDGDDAKRCRMCQTVMPEVCAHCGQKTKALCGKCLLKVPVARPSEPEIMDNGLPRLRPGEMKTMVLDIMRTKPLPAFNGIVGWNSARLAVHLPGRSEPNIRRVLDQLIEEKAIDYLSQTPNLYWIVPSPEDEPPADINPAVPAGETDGGQTPTDDGTSGSRQP